MSKLLMDLSIEKIQNHEQWENELKLFSFSVFMTPEWLGNITSSQSALPVYFRFTDKGKTKAILAGLDVPIVGQNHYRQLYFYSGISTHGNDKSLIRQCKRLLVDFGKRNNYFRITLKSYDQQNYVSASVAGFKKYKRVEYIYQWVQDNDSIFSGIDRDVRRKVRKAKNEGLILKSSFSPSLLNTLNNLLKETYSVRRSKGYGHYTWEYLPFLTDEKIINLLTQQLACFYYIEHEHKVLSIQLVLLIRRKAYGVLMGTSKAGYQKSAPSFLFHELASTLHAENYQYYNIGGVQYSSSHYGLKKFKETLGAQVVQSAEEKSGFLAYPLKYYNPILKLKNSMYNLGFGPWPIKKAIISLCDHFLKKRDEVK